MENKGFSIFDMLKYTKIRCQNVKRVEIEIKTKKNLKLK